MNLRFENDVKTYSIQTEKSTDNGATWFENDVKTYSIQTGKHGSRSVGSLRMM